MRLFVFIAARRLPGEGEKRFAWCGGRGAGGVGAPRKREGGGQEKGLSASMCSRSTPQHAAACRTRFLDLHIGVWKHAAACRSIQFFEFMCLSACSCPVDPELLQTKEMTSYSELCKHIPNVPQSEWVRYIALPAPSPLPDSTAARVVWWDAEKDDFLR